MPWTNSWDEAKPADADNASSLGLQGRTVKLDIRERLNYQHVFGQNTTDDGLHRNISLTSASIAANLEALKVSGFSLTGANAQSFVDLAGTWNTSGTPTAIKLDVLDTGSNAASLLMDLKVGGTSKFSVSKAGVVVAAGGSLPKVAQATTSTTTTLSTSYADVTNLTTSITPSSTSNKVLVRVSVQVTAICNTAGPTDVLVDLKIVRGVTTIATFEGCCGDRSSDAGQVEQTLAQVILEFLDSPASVASTTYKVQGKYRSTTGTPAASINTAGGGTGLSVITLMEVVP